MQWDCWSAFLFSGFSFPSANTDGRASTRHHSYMANPLLDRLFHEYQSLGVKLSTRRTYQAGVRFYQQFCDQFNIQQFPAASFVLHYICTSITQCVSYKTIKIYLAGIHLEHLQRELHDPTDDKAASMHWHQMLTRNNHPHTSAHYNWSVAFPKDSTLKWCILFLVEKRLLWSVCTLAFMASSGPVNLFHQACGGRMSSSQLPATITIDLRQSKTRTNSFRRGYTIQFKLHQHSPFLLKYLHLDKNNLKISNLERGVGVDHCNRK